MSPVLSSSYHQAVTLFRDADAVHWEAMALTYLGHTHRALGQTAEARQAWQHALDVYRARHHTTEAERVQRKLDALEGVPADG